jgi:magnesium-transporting ATPase (P-type)
MLMFMQRYDAASKLIINRSQQLKACGVLVEHSLDLLGAVGIEDELQVLFPSRFIPTILIWESFQDGVPQAISTLLEMGLNVWMITGDKAETAIAISQQCDLLSESHFTEKLLNLSGEALRQRMLDLQTYFDPRRRDLSVSDDCFSMSIGGYEDSPSSATASQVTTGTNLRPSDATAQRNYAGGHNTRNSAPQPPSFGKTTRNFVQPLLNGVGAGGTGSLNGSSRQSNSLRISSSRKSAHDDNEEKKIALIVDGATLEAIWAVEDIKARFTAVVCHVPTVIACRVSPKQKAALVHMIKSGAGHPITLAIGDGANDVGMIHEARVGVGIAGKEGRHAANSSDFAIGQFRFLVPLMLEHGRYNYIRCCKLVLYSFFKNLLLVSVLFYFCIYSGFSGTVPLDSIIFSGYNFYLGLPIIALGAMDMDVPRESVRKHPFLAYRTGRCAELLNLKNMFLWCSVAFLEGYLLFAVGIRMVSGSQTQVGTNFNIGLNGPGLNNSDGQATGLFEVGYLLYSCIFLSMQNKVMLMTTTRTYIHWTLWILSTIGFFSFTWVYGVSPSIDWYNVVPIAFACGQYWLAILLVPVMLAMADLGTDTLLSYVAPSSVNQLVSVLGETKVPRMPVSSVRLNTKFETSPAPSHGASVPRRVVFKSADTDADPNETVNPVPQRASDASTVSDGSIMSSEYGVRRAVKKVVDDRASFGMQADTMDVSESLH